MLIDKYDDTCKHCGNDKFFITFIGGDLCVTCDRCRRIKLVIRKNEVEREEEHDGDVW